MTLDMDGWLGSHIVTGRAVLDLPEPTWLVDGWVPAGAFVMTYGAPKAGKSFAALDMALSIATGRPWASHATARGPVIYVVAEGVGGLPRRVGAWLEHRMADPGELDPIHFVTRRVNLADEAEMSSFERLTERIGPALVVFDTLARCTVGVEENSARDMGQVVDMIDSLRERTEATVMVVHHAGKDSKRGARGSTALLGAVDAAYEVAGGDGSIRMRCPDMKDSERPDAIEFKMMPCGGSVALDAYAASGGKQGDRLDALVREVVEVVRGLEVELGCPPSGNLVRERMKGRHQSILAALELAVGKGALKEGRGDRNARLFSYIGQLPSGRWSTYK